MPSVQPGMRGCSPKEGFLNMVMKKNCLGPVKIVHSRGAFAQPECLLGGVLLYFDFVKNILKKSLDSSPPVINNDRSLSREIVLYIFREPTLGPNLVMHTIFLPESWIFRFCEEYP